MPIDPVWPGAIIAVLIPTTSPFKLNSGPPEFPWLIDASVWIKSSYLVKFISLFLAEIIPEVTVPPKPNGFPIAITQSPTRALSESPKTTGVNSSDDSIFKTAKSAYGSDPRTLALYSLEPTFTKISSAFWITWLLVITIPFLLIMNPEPSDEAFLSVGLW